jgi:hypothetical protein
MEAQPDAGAIAEQASVEIPDAPMTPADVYRWLYPLYVDVTLRVLRRVLR